VCVCVYKYIFLAPAFDVLRVCDGVGSEPEMGEEAFKRIALEAGVLLRQQNKEEDYIYTAGYKEEESSLYIEMGEEAFKRIALEAGVFLRRKEKKKRLYIQLCIHRGGNQSIYRNGR